MAAAVPRAPPPSVPPPPAPGLSGPPGVTGPSPDAPTSLPPPPATEVPPAPAAATSSGAEVQGDILQKISEQVKHRLLQARKDSEGKVKAELKVLNDNLTALDARLDQFSQSLDELETSLKPDSLDAAQVRKALSAVEQQWGKELGKLKQELHQTIYAHNHNADLMKFQKDSLEQLRADLRERRPPAPDQLRHAKNQLHKFDALLKEQQRQRQIEPLLVRLAALEQRIAAAWRWPGMGTAGLPPHAMANMLAAAAAAGPEASAAAATAASAAAAAAATAARRGALPPASAGLGGMPAPKVV